VGAAPALAERAPCLLVNPRSFGAARGALVGRATQLARSHGLHVVHAAHPAEIDAAVEELLATGRPALFLLAGDGTVQRVADRLATLPPHIAQPHLFVLGGGRTNLTAADLGGCGSVLAKLETALRRWREGPELDRTYRHLVRIEQQPNPARHGFFVGAGFVDHAIRVCHGERAKGSGVFGQGDTATAFSLLKLALSTLMGVRRLSLDELHVEAAGHEALPRPARLLIATTLTKRLGLFDPYAERGQGSLRFTALAASGPGMWARLPRVITGRFSPTMEAARGYLSGRCDVLRVRGLSSYTLDGEEFEADPARPVTIASGPRLAFLTL
jgi:diacylglycerol kinase family enzyme